MERRTDSARVGFIAAAIGTALFIYGVMFVVDAVGVFGLVLAVGGGLVAVGAR